MLINKTKKNLTLIILLSGLFLFFTHSLHAQSTPTYNYSSVSASSTFTRDLGIGNRGQDVENLQCILNINGGPSGYYGLITDAAVLQYQNANAASILTPIGLTSGTGFLGSSTRAFMNSQLALYGATSTAPTCPTYSFTPNPGPTPAPLPTPNPVPTPTPTPQPITSTTTSTCPVGYNCTPTQPTNCPAGYSCLPTQPTFGSNGLNNPYSPYSPLVNGNSYNQNQPSSTNGSYQVPFFSNVQHYNIHGPIPTLGQPACQNTVNNCPTNYPQSAGDGTLVLKVTQEANDTDGTWNPGWDHTHDDQTSFTPNGHSLDASQDYYLALPTSWKNILPAGTPVLVSDFTSGIQAWAVVGDFGATLNGGEQSFALNRDLGLMSANTQVDSIPINHVITYKFFNHLNSSTTH